MEPIAIVGMSCLFPDADSPGEFWQNLLREKISIRDAEDEDFERPVLHAYDPHVGIPDKFYYKKSGLIRDFQFQPTGFAAEESELNELDDLHRWVLHTSREALWDAGVSVPVSDHGTCGLVLANLSLPTDRSYRFFMPHYLRRLESFFQNAWNKPALHFDSAATHPPVNPMAEMVSGTPSVVTQKALALHGPCFTLDAACASVLYTIRIASYFLQSGMAEIMLAGGVCKPAYQATACGFSVLRAFPAEGSSMPLDQNSKGITYSEGAGMFALKRLRDAVRDGNRIHAVVEGVGLSNDGAGKPLLNPNPKGQILAMEAAYHETGINKRDIDYIECHATGTPVGDITELNTLEKVFGIDCPLIGGNKANLGHMLTTSGAAGLLKVVFSMQNEEIPATLQVSAPLESDGKIVQADRFVLNRKRWPKRGKTKRAAINCFGFGGSNAHLILSQGDVPLQEDSHQDDRDENREAISLIPMAVIGMGVHFGRQTDLSKFRDSVYFGDGVKKTPFSRQEIGRNATRIDQYEFDFLRYKIPPHETNIPTHQSLLMLKTADEAILDAGWMSDRSRNVAVIVAMEMDEGIHRQLIRQDMESFLSNEFAKAGIHVNEQAFRSLMENLKDAFAVPTSSEQITSFIGNTVAARIASAWDFTGPAFTVSAMDDSSLKALQVAQCLLTFETVEAVVVGAIDLGGSLERTLLRREWARQKGQVDRPFRIAEGAGAVVLARADEANMTAHRVYTEIETIHIQSNRVGKVSRSASFMEEGSRSVREALRLSGSDADEYGYIEVAGNSMDVDWDEWLPALKPVFSRGDNNPLALGSLQADRGDTFAAKGLFSLIKTSICLYHRFLPLGLKDVNPSVEKGFYRPSFSRPWLHDPQSLRKALICNKNMEETVSVAVLRESFLQSTELTRIDGYPHQTRILFLKHDSPVEFNEALERIESNMESGESIHSLADECFSTYMSKAETEGYTLALLAASAEELKREMAAAKSAIHRSVKTGQEWVSSAGSCFVPQPLQEGKIAFVYPMAGGLTVGTGADLPYFFPSVWDALSGINTHDNLYINESLVYPNQSIADPSEPGQDGEIELGQDRLTYFGFSTIFAYMVTHLLQKTFGVSPQTAFGCSIGEFGMLYSFRTLYNQEDETDDRILYELLRRIQPALYNHETLQCYFGDQQIDWKSYYVSGPIDRLARKLAEESRVFLAVQGSPRDAIVSGHRADAERIFQELSCYYTESKDFGFVHTPPAAHTQKIIHDFLIEQKNLAVRKNSALTFLSSVAPYQYELTLDSVAHHISMVMASPIYFNRVVEKAYETGTRIFIDIGPGSLTARWIQETLQNKPVSIVSLNTKGMSEDRGMLAALARLAAHRVPVNLSSLFREENKTGAQSYSKILSINNPGLDEQLASEQLRSLAQEAIENSLESSSVLKDIPAKVEKSRSPQTVSPGVESRLEMLVSDFTVAATSSSTYARECQMQSLYLQVQDAFMHNLENSLNHTVDYLGSVPSVISTQESAHTASRISIMNKKALWDHDDLLEWNEGRVSNVLGVEYAMVDSYPIRARMPSPPFLFVSRITGLQAMQGRLEPCSIEWEYDIPKRDWFTDGINLQGLIPLESSHASIFLFGYIGLDERFGGRNTYRALGSETVMKGDLPKPGDTLKGRVDVRSFVQRGNQLLTFFDYECRVGDRLVLTTSITGGFFPISETKEAKGVLHLQSQRLEARPCSFSPFSPLSGKTSFSKDDLIRYIQGNHTGCFGGSYLSHSNFFVCTPEALMLDGIRTVDLQGGASGLGYLVGEKEIDPSHWIFDAHFKNDPIMPGSLMIEGAYQLLIFYMSYLRLDKDLPGCRFYYLPKIKETTRFRGPVLREKGTLEYRLYVREIHLHPNPQTIADAEILYKGKTIATRENFGVGFIAQS